MSELAQLIARLSPSRRHELADAITGQVLSERLIPCGGDARVVIWPGMSGQPRELVQALVDALREP